jgi:GrpB-like predicted nucleotidyltransferase (UPF0157 family)
VIGEMMKKLNEMTNEELWQLFPIELARHNNDYAQWYESMKQRLLSSLKDDVFRINHIGSTAVKGLIAKPIVDILLEMNKGCSLKKLHKTILKQGFILMNDTLDLPRHYVKGYTVNGFDDEVYHLHVRYPNDYNELYFRDYLRDHLDVCRQYEAVKLSLLKQFKHHRDHYTEGKTQFIESMTKKARSQYKNRYSVKEM